MPKTPNESSFQGLSKTCNLSLLSISETEKYALKRPDPLSESYKGKTLKSGNFCKFHIISFLRACFSSLITARNGGHCYNLGDDSAQGFSDAVVGDSFAIERKISISKWMNHSIILFWVMSRLFFHNS